MSEPYKDKFHLEGGKIVRQISMGLNDGVVSIFALLSGIAGAGQSPKIILITLLAATIAGALSMAAGEYVSNKSEHDFFKHEIEQETLELTLCPNIEKEEIRLIYQSKGFSGKMLDDITNTITNDKKLWIKEMVQEELGVSELEESAGFKTSIIIFFAFVLGSLFPVLPYLLFQNLLDGQTIFIIAIIVTFTGLFIAGAVKKYVTGINWIKSGLEMLIVGIFAFGISYYIGKLVGVAV